MPAQSSPHSSQESLTPDDAHLKDAVQEDDESTQVMGREDLPDFKQEGNGPAKESVASEPTLNESAPQEDGVAQPERRAPQRPSTFTRLLIDPRR